MKKFLLVILIFVVSSSFWKGISQPINERNMLNRKALNFVKNNLKISEKKKYDFTNTSLVYIDSSINYLLVPSKNQEKAISHFISLRVLNEAIIYGNQVTISSNKSMSCEIMKKFIGSDTVSLVNFANDYIIEETIRSFQNNFFRTKYQALPDSNINPVYIRLKTYENNDSAFVDLFSVAILDNSSYRMALKESNKSDVYKIVGKYFSIKEIFNHVSGNEIRKNKITEVEFSKY